MKIDNETKKKKIALSSIAASLCLTIFKLIVGILTGSIGIISEAAHSALDLAAAFITYLAVRVSGHPADLTHHYGHGKAESLSALIETGLLLITAMWIMVEAVQRLIFGGAEIQVAWYSFIVMIISVIVDYSRSKALYKTAKETNSQALEADALHFHTDIYSSLVVIGGLIFVSFGVFLADAIAAIGVSIFVIYASFNLGKRTIDVLMDRAPKEVTDRISSIIEKTDGVISVNRIRVRPVGNSVFIDAVISVGRRASIGQVHKITLSIEKNVKKMIPGADIVVHTKPVAIEGETIVDKIQTISRNNNAYAHDININTVYGEKNINFDLEIPNNLNFKKAHGIASKIEKELLLELGDNVNINSHIEPISSSEINSRTLTSVELSKIYLIINNIRKNTKGISSMHNISAYRAGKKICISMHCSIDKNISIDEVHNLSTRIEDKIKDKLPNIDRVFVHTEPNKKQEKN